MTLFLLWWLVGEALYHQATKDEPADDLELTAELVESELRREFESHRPLTPKESEMLSRVCYGVVATGFFFMPIFWPFVLGPDDDDDWPE